MRPTLEAFVIGTDPDTGQAEVVVLFPEQQKVSTYTPSKAGLLKMKQKAKYKFRDPIHLPEGWHTWPELETKSGEDI